MKKDTIIFVLVIILILIITGCSNKNDFHDYNNESWGGWNQKRQKNIIFLI